MKVLYIYVCYEIKARDDNKDVWVIDMNNQESFSTMNKAVAYCKDNYARYMIAVEKCDEEVLRMVKEYEE